MPLVWFGVCLAFMLKNKVARQLRYLLNEESVKLNSPMMFIVPYPPIRVDELSFDLFLVGF